jgi:hypothetical protein
MDDLTILVYDVECYPNYFMIGYSLAKQDIENNKFNFTRYFVDTREPKQLTNFLNRIYEIKDKLVMVGFNNSYYDKVMVETAYKHRYNNVEDLCKTLYAMSQDLVSDKENGYKYRMFPQFDLHFDESNSLKSSGMILHCDTIQELPYEPTKELTEEEIENVVKYNQDNDLKITEELLNVFYSKFTAQYDVIKTFELPLSAFNFTGRQLAESVLCDSNSTGNPTMTTDYKCPLPFKYQSEELNKLKDMYESSVFKFKDKFGNTIMYNGLEVNFGLGGLHACIPQYEGYDLIDVDVASYYPNLIRVLDMLPMSCKDKNAYAKMIFDRVALKKTDPSKATAYKIILNSVFGAMGYVSGSGKVGKMFDFKRLMQVTITGQLLMMKLVEDLTLAGYKVIYINTDGLMCERNGSEKYKEIIKNWEEWTKLQLEENSVKFAMLKDVNNYIIDEGKIKSKGVFNLSVAGARLTTNYAKRRIVIQSVIDYVLNKTPIEETIRNSNDIRDFIIHWKFGSQFVDRKCGDKPLGKVCRWYISNKSKDCITSINSTSGNAYSPQYANNVVLVDDISKITEIPKDLDYDFYINESYSLYKDLTGKHIGGNTKAMSMLEELKERLGLC